MKKLFDTHAHYFDKRFCALEGGADALLGSQIFQNTVCGVVNVGTSCENSIACIEQAKKYGFMYASVGIHPEDAQNSCRLSLAEEIGKIEDLLCDSERRKENKIVAIGEIGYDYYWQPVDKKLQREYFYGQMELARKYCLPVIIHNRDAHADTFEMLCEFPDVTGVLHSCSMSAEMVKEIVKRGWYVSFSGTLTFKNAERVRDACRATPLDRLLIETDAPYLAPVPHRGKLNDSTLMVNTAQAAADIFNLSFDEIAGITAKNAEKLFKIQ